MTVGLFGQVQIIAENNVTGINSIGIQVSKNHFGVYCMVGSNVIMRGLGVNVRYNSTVKGDFYSTVKWYDKNGSYYPTYPPTKYFTSSEWGNQLLETGYCRNTLETVDEWTTEKHDVINAGVVIPIFKTYMRIGGGLYRERITGTHKYHKWTHEFNVSKYYDQWGVVAQPSGIFTVVTGGKVRTQDYEVPINVDRVLPNINFSIAVLQDYNYTDLTLGYDSRNGINFGLTYHIHK